VTDELDTFIHEVFRRPEEERLWAMRRFESFTPPRLGQLRVAKIECAVDRRRLLEIWEEDDGQRYYFRARYTRSARMNLATSNEGGRLRNTEDGDRKWRKDAGRVGVDSTFLLSCQHHYDHLVKVDQLSGGRRRRPVFKQLDLGGSLSESAKRR
jgi:hypothetical protein